jgi:hypothetical protein
MRKAAGVIAAFGALIVLTTDFGGWYSREISQIGETSVTGSGAETFYFFRGADQAGAINLLTMPYGLLLLVVAGLLVLTAYLAFRATRIPVPAWSVPAGAAGLTLLLGLIFVAVMLIEDPNDWWLDTGFYAGLVTGAAAAFALAREKFLPA